ncbi:MAG: hypothetical protein IJR65_07855 [Oscillospiraceae bacterium]|nr:hypothetical protein [Oscillospiraceae bacterium]
MEKPFVYSPQAAEGGGPYSRFFRSVIRLFLRKAAKQIRRKYSAFFQIVPYLFGMSESFHMVFLPSAALFGPRFSIDIVELGPQRAQ